MAASPQQPKQDGLDIQHTIKHLEQQNASSYGQPGKGFLAWTWMGSIPLSIPQQHPCWVTSPMNWLANLAIHSGTTRKLMVASIPKRNVPFMAPIKTDRWHHGDTEIFWRKDGSSFPAEYTSTPD